MNAYQIHNMIIDDFDVEETVTVEFHYENHLYSITFDKADLEIINTWIYKEGTSLPTNLSEEMIESLREDVKKRI